MKELETTSTSGSPASSNNMVSSNGGSTILARPIMAMDGNLLSAFWNKGACIPDKLVDKTDVLNELIDEILMSMKMKSVVHDPADLLDLIQNHRRGSTSISKKHSVKPKEKQRRSWGPDDTWSSRFVTKQTLQHAIATPIVSKKDIVKNGSKKEISSSKKPSASKKSKHSKKTYKHANTESIINLRKCQPLGGFHARGNNIRRTNDDYDDDECDGADSGDESNEIDLRLHDDRKLSQKRRELMKMMSWVCDEGYDYIHSEQVKNLSEAEIFLDVMLSSTIPVQMTLKVNSPTDINITYQFLPNFKEEYMVLNISKTHCMVMRAF